MDAIVNKTFQALSFYIFAIRYLKKRSPYFRNIINYELIIKLAIINNPDLIVTDLKKEVIKTNNKCIAERKKWFVKLYAFIRFFSSLYFKSSFFYWFI